MTHMFTYPGCDSLQIGVFRLGWEVVGSFSVIWVFLAGSAAGSCRSLQCSIRCLVCWFERRFPLVLVCWAQARLLTDVSFVSLPRWLCVPDEGQPQDPRWAPGATIVPAAVPHQPRQARHLPHRETLEKRQVCAGQPSSLRHASSLPVREQELHGSLILRMQEWARCKESPTGACAPVMVWKQKQWETASQKYNLIKKWEKNNIHAIRRKKPLPESECSLTPCWLGWW